jgi:tetratricopeptide (TPR) repeat protein
MTAIAIRFKTAMMYAASPKPMHQEMAIEELKKALEMEPKHTDSLFNLGVLYCRRGDLAAALHYFKRYIVLEKDETVAGLISYLEEKLKENQASRFRTKRLGV